ncbi:MAG: esterase [Porticoccus sp.]|jgi:esterase
METTLNKAVKLNYVKQGQGPCVLVCHGLYGSLANFASLAKQLEKKYTVIRVDLRNHGKSPHTLVMTQQAMADDLVLLLDELGISRAVVIGHSLGGKVAMTFAQQNPQLASGLVIVDIAPVEYAADSHNNVFSALKSVDLTTINSRKDADEALAQHLAEASLRQFLLTNLERTTNGFQWRINLDVLISEYQDIAAAPPVASAYVGAVALIKGSESTYINDAMLPAIKQRFPNCVVNTVSGTGHWLHAEKPVEFIVLVEEFLNTLF